MGNELSTGSDPSDALANLLETSRRLAAVLEAASSSHDDNPLRWDPKDCSDNVDVFDNGSKVRRKDAPDRTDMVRATHGYKMGVHVWEITWPRASRGTHAVIGMASTRAPLTCSGHKPLVGSNDQSLGWDIVNNKSLYDNRVINTYPPNKPPGYQVGDRIVVILNLHEGTISFCDGDEKLGMCLSGLQLFVLKYGQLCPAVSMTEPGAVVEIRDLSRRTGTGAPSAGLSLAASTTLHFTIPNDDKGLELTNDNMSAFVSDASMNNKMALSDRPLENEELFQIKIDKLENDETTPVLLHVGLVDRSDNTQQWTLASSHILYRGEQLQQFTKLNLDELQQGQRVGLMRRSSGRLDVYIDGKLKAKCNINIPRGVCAYVCLDGRAKQVTIVPERVEMAALDANPPKPEASAQLRFGGLSGANIDLSDGGRTASRKDCSLNDDNGIAMATRPLKAGELFEVRVDEEVIDRWEAGLRIGVVQSASSAWDSSVPPSLSLMQKDLCRVWLWSGATVMGDSSMLTSTSTNLDKVEKGDRVGLYQTSVGDLFFTHNGRKVAQVSNVPTPVTPAVDVHGRITRVSLTDDSGKMLDAAGNWQVEKIADVPVVDETQLMVATTSTPKTPEELEKGIKKTLALMNEKDSSAVNDVVMAVCENIIEVTDELTSDEHRVLLANKIAELGGGPTIVEYLHFLRDLGLEIEHNFTCYYVILSALWNWTDDSMTLSMALAENGLFELLYKQLTSLKIALAADKKKFGPLFGTCLGIVCNCAKRSENRNHLLKVKLDEVLQHYVNISNSDENTILYCYTCVMFILPSKAVDQLVISIPALRKLVGFLKVAAADSAGGFYCPHNFGPLGESIDMHGYELVMAVSALAQNKVARKDMADNGVFEHLVKYGAADTDTYHQELTLTAIHALLGHDTVPIALQVSGLLPLIDELMTSTTDGVRQAATRVSEKIMALKIPPKPTTLAGMRQLKPKDKTRTCDFALLCQKFFVDLKLPDDYFDSAHHNCYCAKCYEAASSSQLPYHSRGQPAKDYGIPIGWYRYGLKVPPKADAEDAFNVYHRAYHGTDVTIVPNIIREGYLLIPGDETMDGARIREKDGHYTVGRKPLGFDTKQVFLSPSIRYVANPAYARPSRVTIDGKEYKAQVVMQVLIHPDAYTVGRQTVGAKTQIDPRFSNDEMEWSTKRRGAIILYGLLVRVMEE